MENQVKDLRHQFQNDLKEIKNSRDLEQLKIKYMGRKGPIQDLMQGLRGCPEGDRPRLGKLINDLKVELSDLCDQAYSSFLLHEQAARLAEEKVDVTLPGRKNYLGRKHPISLMRDELLDIFTGMGFSVQYGPEIDSDYYNFEGLNYPSDHPARDMQDTFYVTDRLLLRSQTSNTQLHVMEHHRPPIRIVAPGTVYRNENVSARSHVFFHQIEGLYIDRDVSFADLLTTMEEFLYKLFQTAAKTRFRPSYFPFVEPGLEVDIQCTSCHGQGCRLCKHTGWLEILGAGMVHPEVLNNGGIDPDQYSGFAWGLGIERLALMRYGIKDIRQFFENDQRLLAQFSCSC